MDGITNSGALHYISTTVQNEDLTESEFSALNWTQLPNVGNLGNTGSTQDISSYSTHDRPVKSKGKGEADAGSPVLEMLDVASAGLTLLEAAAAATNTNNYAFKTLWADGSIEYNRGIVTGPERMKGANSDFKRLSFNLGLNQLAIPVDAP